MYNFVHSRFAFVQVNRLNDLARMIMRGITGFWICRKEAGGNAEATILRGGVGRRAPKCG